MTEINIAEWNCGGRLAIVNNNELGRFLRDQVAPFADVIALEEAGKRGPAITEYLPDWQLAQFQPVDFAITVPIVVRPGITVTGSVAHRISKEENVGSEGAGPPMMHNKAITGLFLEMEDGKDLNIWNKHNVASVDANDQRDELHEKQIRNELFVTGKYAGRQVWLGDWNVSPDHPNLDPVYEAGWILDGPDRPTHMGTRRRIDLQFHRGPIDYTGDWKLITGTEPNDHRVLIMRYEF